ncbi:MAG: glycosyltransferase family 9 protein, partial [Armatimonadota bacterium]|nr:glycosyltransferase family 9 protein [Armatimonadota bacterium]
MKRIGNPSIFILRGGAIGDCILSTPAIAALRRSFPESHITLIGDPFSAPIFENSPDIDRLIALDRKTIPLPIYLAKLLRLRLERPALLVDLHGGARTAVQSALIGGRRRVGWQSRKTRSFVYTDHVADPKDVHFVLRQAALLEPLGVSLANEDKPPRLVLLDAERAQARRLLAEAGHPPQKPFVIMQATAGEYTRSLKQWPPERYASLA